MTMKPLTFIFCLLSPGLLFAQTGQAPAPARPPAQRGQLMYEDIEIMRRIINRKLAGWPSLIALNQRCAACHVPQGTFFKNIGGGKFVDIPLEAGLGTKGAAVADLDNDGNLDLFVGRMYSKDPDGRVILGDFDKNGQPDLFVLSNPHQANPHVLLSIPFNTEGVYLKGHGVVYTVTLPPPPRVARRQDKKVPDKPLSDWERIRRQVRGNKDEPAANEASQVDDWIDRNLGDNGQLWLTEAFLKILAENGQHFSQLPENEKLTVAVTFRDTGQLKGVTNFFQESQKGTLESWGAQAYPEASQTWNVQQVDPLQSWQNQQPALKSGQGSGGGGGAGGAAAGPGEKNAPSSIRDFELLGDLHLRQGKAREAIKTYQQALNLDPEPKRAAAIYRKIAQADLALEDDAGAKKALEMAQQFLNIQGQGSAGGAGTTKPPAAGGSANVPPAAPAVSKLIISAPKRLLDQVGSGKLGFHEFEKQVTVDYVTSEKNKPGPPNSK